MMRRTLNINSKMMVSVAGSPLSLKEIEQTVYQLASSNQIGNNDVLMFGIRGLRVNHIPCVIQDGKLVRVGTFRKPYVSQKGRKANELKLKYRVEGNSAIFVTKQSSPVEFIVDLEDVNKLVGRRWQAHTTRGKVYICNRTHNVETGKWTVTPLVTVLGYNPKKIQYKNGNYLDLRKENIIAKESYFGRPCKK